MFVKSAVIHISVYLNKEPTLVLLFCVRIYYIRFEINIGRSKMYTLPITTEDRKQFNALPYSSSLSGPLFFEFN